VGCQMRLAAANVLVSRCIRVDAPEYSVLHTRIVPCQPRVTMGWEHTRSSHRISHGHP
jgi:hypothetical protein